MKNPNTTIKTTEWEKELLTALEWCNIDLKRQYVFPVDVTKTYTPRLDGSLEITLHGKAMLPGQYVKSFIQSLLTKQRTDLIKEVEGKCLKSRKHFEGQPQQYRFEGYNQALSDVLNLLKQDKQ